MTNKYFKISGDLKLEKKHNIEDYFKPAGDLSDNNQEMNDSSKIEDIKNYLLSIVSGKEYDFESELGTLCSGGSMIVSLSQLKEMVEDGTYNIIKAEYLNPNFIAIEFQQFQKSNDKGFSK